MKEYLCALDAVNKGLWWSDEVLVEFCREEKKKLREAVEPVGSKFGVEVDQSWYMGEVQL
jgi:hypothetical protein